MEDLDEILKAIDIATNKLHSLSGAFFLTGNEVMSDKLYDIAHLICDAPKGIRAINHEATMKILDDGNEQLRKIITSIIDKNN